MDKVREALGERYLDGAMHWLSEAIEITRC